MESQALHQIIGDKYVVKLCEEVLDVNEAIDAVNGHSCGAVSLFMGVTRRTESDDTSGRRPVQCLVYEAYHSMAIKQMQTIVEQNMAAYGSDRIHKCYVCHRLGRVNVGQTSIVIACSAPHRTEAHQLVLKLLDDIKAMVPIWKRIVYHIHDTHEDTDQRLTTDGEWSDKSEAFWLNSNTTSHSSDPDVTQ